MSGIGAARMRITWNEKTRVAKPGAGGESTYAAILTTWAEMIPLRYNRDEQANQIQGRIQKRFKMRQRDGFTPTKSMTVNYAGREYVPISIEPYQDREWYWFVEIQATE